MVMIVAVPLPVPILDEVECVDDYGPYCRVCEGPTDYALSRCTWCGAEDPCELMRG